MLTAALWLLLLHAGSFLALRTDTPGQADLIVLLGGDTGARARKGLELFLQDSAPRVLITGMEGGELPVQPYYLDWRMNYLEAQGIGKDAMLLDRRSQNSWEEAKNTLNLMQERGWKRVIVVSDPPHLRRLKWVWDKAFRGSGSAYFLCPSIPSWWDKDRWWNNEISAKFVIQEYLKLAYYIVKYR